VSLSMTPSEAEAFDLKINKDGQRRSAFDLLAYPDMHLARLAEVWPELGEIDSKTAERLEIEAQYDVYLQRQSASAALLRREEERIIPDGMDFAAISGISNELKQKLAVRKPKSIAEAKKIDGMTPAAMALVLLAIRHRGKSEMRGAA
jgi:tRNA uridine 5-carboxymethylaminomethyl modification enzyme